MKNKWRIGCPRFVSELFWHVRQREGVSLLIAVIFVSFLLFEMIALGGMKIRGAKNNAVWYTNQNIEKLAVAASRTAAAVATDYGVGCTYASPTQAANAGGFNFCAGGGGVAAAYGAALDAVANDIGQMSCPRGVPVGDPQRCFKKVGMLCAGGVPCWGFGVIGSNVVVNANGPDDTRLRIGADRYYSVPSPVWDSVNNVMSGGGDALPTCANNTAAGADTAEKARNADNGCHWNRIAVGQTVDIPLYVDPGGGAPITVIDATNLRLRVRTPCENFNNVQTRDTGCTAGGRIALYPDPDTQQHAQAFLRFGQDPVLIQWQIVDEASGETLLASDVDRNARNPEGVRPDLELRDMAKPNTELTSGRINAAFPLPRMFDFNDLASPFTVLVQNYNGRLVNQPPQPPTVQSFITRPNSRPVLRLSMIDRPIRAYLGPRSGNHGQEYNPANDANDDRFNVPYLEYQLLSSGGVNARISDPRPTVLGWARVGNSTRVMQKKVQVRQPGSAGFALDRF